MPGWLSWVLMALGAFLLLLVALTWQQTRDTSLTALFGPQVEIDLEQPRLDTPLPLLQGNLKLSQTFVPRHHGLQEIELTFVRYGQQAAQNPGWLRLALYDEREGLVADETLRSADLENNQVYRFTFAPQANSSGQRYRLELSGSEENTVSVGGYSLDVYPGGALLLREEGQDAQGAATTAQDLRFTTRYALTWRGAAYALRDAIYYEGLLFLAALLLLPLPGCLLLLILHSRQQPGRTEPSVQEDGDSAWPWDPGAWWGVSLALGVAAWALLWRWLTLVDGRWAGWSLWLVVAAGWLVVVLAWWRERRLRRRIIELAADMASIPPRAAMLLSWRRDHVLLLLILLAGLAVRLLAVRDVVFPPWVDSSRHGLITAVMTLNGQAMDDYLPLLPVDRFPYHDGFHSLASSLALMTGWPLARLLLNLGQLLNALVPLTIYAAVWLVTRRRQAGIVAAFLVALPFFFPAYYATWGRLTQLTAVLLLPVLLALTWQLLAGGRLWRGVWWLVSVLAAGLLLVHFRVFLYYVPFAFLVWLAGRGRNGRWLAASAGLAVLLVLPRLAQLLQATDPLRVLGQTIPNYNEFPTSYFEAGWEQALTYAAGVALLIAFGAGLRGRRWARLPLVLAAWVAALFLLLSVERLGLPVPALVNLNSMYITLFVPLAILLGIVAGHLWQALPRQHWLVRTAGFLLAGGLLASLGLFGVQQQIGILNPQTILAVAEDQPALAWVAENLPPEAVLAVNSWRWLGETWAAADGGAWLLPLAARQATTPPVDHIYDAELFRQVREFNATAAAVSDWSDPQQADWLRQQGVTHIFVGKRGGFLDPAVLARNPALDAVYGHAGVFVFALRP